MRDPNFYLEFTIGSAERFASLARMFSSLKQEKDRIVSSYDSDTHVDDDPAQEPDWIEYLDEQALQWFSDTFDFTSEEGKTYQQRWNLTTPEVRLAHPMFHVPANWDFESMIEALFAGEYVLIDLAKETDDTGVLYYDPWAGPFGGTEALVCLIESFGHRVTFDSWHEGPHRRHTSAWDYSLAKKLVAAGKGFTPS